MAGEEFQRRLNWVILESRSISDTISGWSTIDLHTILIEVDSWPVEERIRLVQEVWNRLANQGHHLELFEDMKLEIDRRLSAHETNPNAAIPWEQVEADSLAHLRLLPEARAEFDEATDWYERQD